MDKATGEQINTLVKNLSDLFLPHMANALDWDSHKDEATKHASNLVEDPQLKALIQDSTLSREDEEDLKRAVLGPVAKTLVVSWLQALAMLSENKIIDTASLDRRMLPKGAKADLTVKMTACYDENQAHGILRCVHANLPERRALPEDAEKALELKWGITVV